MNPPVDYNPFSPGKPIQADKFVGRTEEFARLTKHIKSVNTGSLKVAFISGDRGIGKSSLATAARSYAEREENMVGVHVFLGGADTLDQMTKRVLEALLRESQERHWYDPIKELFANHVKQVGFLGIQLTLTSDSAEIEALRRNFAVALRTLTMKLRDAGKAVSLMLILDDLNGLAVRKDFADWLKSLIDEIATNAEPTPLLLALVGLEERRHAIIEQNPSLARAMDVFHLKPWEEHEATRFFIETFDEVNITVDADAVAPLAKYSGGRPEIAHEIGAATFDGNTDRKISRDDALRGILQAVRILGEKYLKAQLIDELNRSKNYQPMLIKVAKFTGSRVGLSFELSEIKQLLDAGEVAVLGNFLRRMKELGIFISEGGGSYRFASYIHLLYMLVYDLDQSRQRTHAAP